MKFPKLPPTLALRLDGYNWQRDNLGGSGAHTFRLQGKGEAMFLKIADSSFSACLQAEAERTQWLNSHLPVPTIHHFEITTDGAFLLMTAVPGNNVTHFNDRPDSEKEMAVQLLAIGLHQLHNLPFASCPFDQRLDRQIEKAQQRMAAGRVDASDFDEERRGQKPHDLFDELLATRPTSEDVVFTHGDYCLPNVMIESGRLTGFIDLGNAGIADRYQDLALCTRSLTYNFGPGWEELFWQSYSLTQPDIAKLAFYRLLDEFF